MNLLSIFLMLFPLLAFAWGPTGHRVVGMIAERHLEPVVGLKVYKLLKGSSLARVANWPDEIKSDPATYQYTFNWHYTDWKDGDESHDEANSSGKLLTSIREQLLVLKDEKTSDDKKIFALKFLVHLVGDLHQPLHVGNGLDRGGNTCMVLFHNQRTNLHALWDEGLIDFTKLSYTELANFVSHSRTREEIESWRGGEIIEWANESRQLRLSVYPPEQQKYCRTGSSVESADMPKLGYEYSYKFMPVLEKRLFQAGLRLGRLLNENLR
jgi:hypothetical protein